ncbi:MAG: hypothetical protein IJ816_01425 [Alloprevotella sp.]|nr:hypothetical protein [Alloprevotella sp.]
MRKLTLLFIIAVLSACTLHAQQRKRPNKAVFPMAKIDSLLAVGKYDEAIEKLNVENLEFPQSKDSLLRIAQRGNDMLQSVKSVKLISHTILPRNAVYAAIPRHKEECLLIEHNEAALLSDYQNGYGDKRIVSGSTQHQLPQTKLYETYKIGGLWTSPEALDGLGEKFEDIRNPFLLSDGLTLYFSAKEAQSVSGFDLYVTRYDLDTHTYFKPENLGFPFSSMSNDYLFWIDELENRIYLISDRGCTSDSLSLFVIENQEDFNFLPYNTDAAELRKAALLYVPKFQMPLTNVPTEPSSASKPVMAKPAIKKKNVKPLRKKR